MNDWTTVRIGALCVHQGRSFAAVPGLLHGFTTRMGGVSEPPYAGLNLGAHVGDDPARVYANREALCAALHIGSHRVVTAKQVHGTGVAAISKNSVPPTEADALITNEPGHLLMQFFADCAAVFIADPETRAIALVHAGWRGAAGNIIEHALNSIVSYYGKLSNSAMAAVGPCIGPRYEVGDEVACALKSTSHVCAQRSLFPKEGSPAKWSLDLRAFLRAQLSEFGLRSEAISISAEDTFADSESFFSYRRDGSKTGRMAAYIGWE